ITVPDHDALPALLVRQRFTALPRERHCSGIPHHMHHIELTIGHRGSDESMGRLLAGIHDYLATGRFGDAVIEPFHKGRVVTIGQYPTLSQHPREEPNMTGADVPVGIESAG